MEIFEISEGFVPKSQLYLTHAAKFWSYRYSTSLRNNTKRCHLSISSHVPLWKTPKTKLISLTPNKQLINFYFQPSIHKKTFLQTIEINLKGQTCSKITAYFYTETKREHNYQQLKYSRNAFLSMDFDL